MIASPAPVLLVPGIDNSGPGHWQSLWQSAAPGFHRVQQRDWQNPERDPWVAALEDAVARHPGAVLAAHSLGCLLVVHWAATQRAPVRGALLVAVPDPTGPNFPPQARGFHPLPLAPLPFPSIVVASSNDPYSSLDFARRCAAAWGSRWVPVGPLGHINSDSQLGAWADGLALLESLRM
jgi:predicted alpha/beta hydrolase family esterase